MRRVAVQAWRTARRSQNIRRPIDVRLFTNSPVNYARRSRVGVLPYTQGQAQSPLQSSLQLRSLAILVISSLVASGAWFAYKENPSEKGLRTNPSGGATAISSVPSAFTTSLSSPSSTTSQGPSSLSTADPEISSGASRKTLVVQNDQFFTGDFGDEPVSKQVDGSGRLVVEMLTPEQATQKLRQNQESYLVQRGQGVIRYDVVQLPSNNPIEDDHVEKIITTPNNFDGTSEKSGSDWSFWGVFDGHRYKYLHNESKD
jgi:pyruvate dehydrogenase phosphatase